MTLKPGSLELSVSIGDASFSASGEKSVVLDAYVDFKDLLANGVAPAASGHSKKKAESSPTSRAEGVKSPTELPLKPYLERLKLKGNKQKAAAIIAWSVESGGESTLTAGELKKMWKKTPFKPPANLPRDLGAAEAEGWLDREGKSGSPEAKYSINGYGEGIVASWAEPSS